MRSDGAITYYLVQHRDGVGWNESHLESFLFDGLTFAESRGALGQHRRDLLEPQSASSDLWQKFGIHGFIEVADARAAVAELRMACPNTCFRLMRRHIMQDTEEVST